MSITGKSALEGGHFKPSYGISHENGLVDTKCPYINKNFATWTLVRDGDVPQQLTEMMNEEFLDVMGKDMYKAVSEKDFHDIVKKYIEKYEWPHESVTGFQVLEENTAIESIFSFFCMPVTEPKYLRRLHFDLHLLRPYFVDRIPKEPVRLSANPMYDAK
jgi:hypothetical protein